MVEVGRDLDLVQETLGAYGGCEFGTEDLNRDLAIVFHVVGKVDGRHTTRTEFVLNGVAVGEGRSEPVHRISHGRSSAFLC